MKDQIERQVKGDKKTSKYLDKARRQSEFFREVISEAVDLVESVKTGVAG